MELAMSNSVGQGQHLGVRVSGSLYFYLPSYYDLLSHLFVEIIIIYGQEEKV